MNEDKLRAWWSHRQGLDGSLVGATSKEVLERSGWARSVGGVGPYLTLFARAGISREAVDHAVKLCQIHELPSARGCTYVVSEHDFALALRVGQPFNLSELRVASKLGVTENELRTLQKVVLKSLENGALSPDQIKVATGEASRSLGDEGKKKGVTTTLPLALGQLQSSGNIRRIPQNGRLDQQRYRYALWKPSPLDAVDMASEVAYTELARRFFKWIGPATLAEFQWFSGLGIKAAKAATATIGLVQMESDSFRLLLEEDVDEFRKFRRPTRPQYSLVSSLDAIQTLRRDMLGLLDKKDQERPVFAEKSLQPAGRLSDLPSHAIMDRGCLVGLWEYDMETQTIAYSCFGSVDKALTKEIKKTETYVREQLGDARSFSLDSPTSRAPRIQALRAATS